MIIFPDLPTIEVEGVEVAEEITLTLGATSPTASCPSWGTASSRIQSRSTRTLHDLPSVGHPIRPIMHVRRFFCKRSTCAQKIFVERLPELCHPHAQRTKRLQEALRQLGLSMGGQKGADVGSEHGINGSRDTILRLVHQSKPSAKLEPHVIGLDDWAWKRRMRYGTLICDLEQGCLLTCLLLLTFKLKRMRLGRLLISFRLEGVANGTRPLPPPFDNKSGSQINHEKP